MTLEKPTFDDELQYEAVKKAGPAAVSQFMDMLANGESVRMAAMMATRKAPTMGITDHLYHKNMPKWREGMTPIVAKAWNAEYRRRTGENIPDDAIVMRGFAEFPGDPGVVLTSKHSLQDLKRVMELRGKRIESDDFETNPVQLPPTPQQVRMDPALVEEYRQEYIQADPSLAQKDQRELVEQIVETHTKKVTADDLNPEYGTTFEDLARTLHQRSKRAIRVETSDRRVTVTGAFIDSGTPAGSCSGGAVSPAVVRSAVRDALARDDT